MSQSIPMTPVGYQRLQEELKRLIREERPRVVQDIAEARSHGDLSENAEYDATKDRQGDIAVLFEEGVEAFVVIGGHHSANTCKLAMLARKTELPTYHIETAKEIDAEEMSQFATVGVTAGASTPEFLISEVCNRLAAIDHKPIESVSIGNDLKIRAKVTSQRPIKKVRLYIRSLNQTIDWQHIEMKLTEDSEFMAVIPAEKINPRWDFMYYIEAIDRRGGVLWPSWQERQPYVVVKVKKSSN